MLPGSAGGSPERPDESPRSPGQLGMGARLPGAEAVGDRPVEPEARVLVPDGLSDNPVLPSPRDGAAQFIEELGWEKEGRLSHRVGHEVSPARPVCPPTMVA